MLIANGTLLIRAFRIHRIMLSPLESWESCGREKVATSQLRRNHALKQ
ncbi:hypothetical protein M514_20286 [Trichuris suis]|uniref:Uncharacterized protein n=1 Tax=Trichuris suis TaxID=68888 RepID=A0A085NDR3_9BILA|nr:hypothetical protein M514_20286 [Trichuris suis]